MSNDLLQYEKEVWEKGELLVGIDEAGRGPLAGPVVIAGVVFPAGYYHPEINDSKKLSAKKREALFDEIKDNALYYEIRIVSAKEIDESNIYAVTKNAMSEIAQLLPVNEVLTDAMPLSIEKHVQSIIKGDAKSISIAAASILAKVTRDRIMEEYDAIYPHYNFKKHKGYGTKEHLAALEKYGPCPIHRYSFAPVFQSTQPKLF